MIYTNTFGATVLTGADAGKFRNQVAYGRPKAAAINTLRRGVELAKEFAASGYVKLKTKP